MTTTFRPRLITRLLLAFQWPFIIPGFPGIVALAYILSNKGLLGMIISIVLVLTACGGAWRGFNIRVEVSNSEMRIYNQIRMHRFNLNDELRLTLVPTWSVNPAGFGLEVSDGSRTAKAVASSVLNATELDSMRRFLKRSGRDKGFATSSLDSWKARW